MCLRNGNSRSKIDWVDRETVWPNPVFQSNCAPLSFSITSLKSHGVKCPKGSIATIFLLSPHWAKGPIFAAGSVFVKSGLYTCISASVEPTKYVPETYGRY